MLTKQTISNDVEKSLQFIQRVCIPTCPNYRIEEGCMRCMDYGTGLGKDFCTEVYGEHIEKIQQCERYFYFSYEDSLESIARIRELYGKQLTIW